MVVVNIAKLRRMHVRSCAKCVDETHLKLNMSGCERINMSLLFIHPDRCAFNYVAKIKLNHYIQLAHFPIFYTTNMIYRTLSLIMEDVHASVFAERCVPKHACVHVYVHVHVTVFTLCWAAIAHWRLFSCGIPFPFSALPVCSLAAYVLTLHYWVNIPTKDG